MVFIEFLYQAEFYALFYLYINSFNDWNNVDNSIVLILNIQE